MKTVLVVQTNAVEGRADEFNDWYDRVHIPEVLAVPGFVGAQRFINERLTHPAVDEPLVAPYKFIAFYDVEGDPQTALNELMKARPTFDMSDAMESERVSLMYVPLGPHVSR